MSCKDNIDCPDNQICENNKCTVQPPMNQIEIEVLVVLVLLVCLFWATIGVSTAAVIKLSKHYHHTTAAVVLIVLFGIFFPLPIPVLIISSIIVGQSNSKRKSIMGMKRRV